MAQGPRTPHELISFYLSPIRSTTLDGDGRKVSITKNRIWADSMDKDRMKELFNKWIKHATDAQITRVNEYFNQFDTYASSNI